MSTPTPPAATPYDAYTGYGRELGKDPGEGDHGFEKANLPFGVRPPTPWNRDYLNYAASGQSDGYLANSDAVHQAEGAKDHDIDGLPLTELQEYRRDEWETYHEAQRTAASDDDTVDGGVGTGG